MEIDPEIECQSVIPNPYMSTIFQTDASSINSNTLDVMFITKELTKALDIITSTNTSPVDRKAAHQFCENFKENSPLCIECGFLLSSVENPPILRHFGLQLIEHSIKGKWNNFQPGEKIALKNKILELLSSGTLDVLKEHAYVKDGVSKLVVEIISREWPQYWPNMVEEVLVICLNGETQTELVFLVFRRLAEEVSDFDNLPKRRRKDIYQALLCHMSHLFSFFLTKLKHYSSVYLETSLSTCDAEKEKLISTLLCTLTCYVDWAPWKDITMYDNLLLQILYSLLADINLRLVAVECLLALVGRKSGKVEDRTPLLVLFSEDAMNVIFSTACATAEKNLHEATHYLYLKRLCQILVTLGVQLASMWGTVSDVQQPQSFNVYLNAILAISKHPSLMLFEIILSLWTCFFNHDIISNNTHVLSVVPDILKIFVEQLMKVGHPSQNNSLACEFSRLDFDSDLEFNTFHGKIRNQILFVLRPICKQEIEIAYRHGALLLRNLLTSTESDPMTNSTQLSVQLEAVATFLGEVFSILHATDQLKNHPECIKLLQMVLNYEVKDAATMSPLLSCISALFVAVTINKEFLLPVLDKLFGNAVFSFAPTEAHVDMTILKDIRKHACNCIVKVSREHPKLLFTVFDYIYQSVKKVTVCSVDKSFKNQTILCEALVILSNEFENYSTQFSLLDEILSSTKEIWLNFKKDMASPQSFLSFIGLECPVPQNTVDEKGNNRMQITHCLDMFLAAIRRTKSPDDLDVCKKGEFYVESSYGPYIRNAAVGHILPFVEDLFVFVRNMHCLYDPSIMCLFPSHYSSVLDIPKVEKNLLVLCSSDEENEEASALSPAGRFKNFLLGSYDSCLQIFGKAVLYSSAEIYSIPNFATIVHDNIFHCIEHLPDYKLKTTIRFFFKPLFSSQSPRFFDIAASVLEKLCIFMYNKLTPRWENIEISSRSSAQQDDITEEKEILADPLNRALTKEYIEFLGSVTRSSKWVDVTSEPLVEEKNCASTLDKLSDFGLFILQDVHIRPVLVCTLFCAIHWLDTDISYKSASISTAVFKQLVKDNLVSTENEAKYLLQKSLLGLSLLGEHNEIQVILTNLALTIYTSMRPAHPGIKDLFLDITNCGLMKLQNFDSMFLQDIQTVQEKKKRDTFRSLVSNIVGKNVGQLFKNDTTIKNLPPIFRDSKKHTLDVTDSTYENICVLFSRNVNEQL